MPKLLWMWEPIQNLKLFYYPLTPLTQRFIPLLYPQCPSDPSECSTNKIFYKDSKEVKMPSTTLDQIIKDQNIKRVDFMQIDVETNIFDVFNGPDDIDTIIIAEE